MAVDESNINVKRAPARRKIFDWDEELYRWLPTRKWWATAIPGVLTILAHAAGTDGWDNTESAELFTLAAGLSSAYLTTNHATAHGLPQKNPGRSPGL
jgi:hypothetical protein